MISALRSANSSGDLQLEMRVLGIELVQDVAGRIEITVRDQLVPNLRRFVLTDLGFRAVLGPPHKLGEGDLLDPAELDAEILLELGLQGAREVLIGLVGDDGQAVDRLVMHALAGLVDRQAKPAADLLPLLLGRLRLIERANLEDVRDCPSPRAGRSGRR